MVNRYHPSLGGETGRRTGLKILGPSGRAGSIPALGTKSPSILEGLFFYIFGVYYVIW